MPFGSPANGEPESGRRNEIGSGRWKTGKIAFYDFINLKILKQEGRKEL